MLKSLETPCQGTKCLGTPLQNYFSWHFSLKGGLCGELSGTDPSMSHVLRTLGTKSGSGKLKGAGPKMWSCLKRVPKELMPEHFKDFFLPKGSAILFLAFKGPKVRFSSKEIL